MIALSFAPTKRWFAAAKQYADKKCATSVPRSSTNFVCFVVVLYLQCGDKSIFRKISPDLLVYKINYFIFAPDLRATK